LLFTFESCRYVDALSWPVAGGGTPVAFQNQQQSERWRFGSGDHYDAALGRQMSGIVAVPVSLLELGCCGSAWLWSRLQMKEACCKACWWGRTMCIEPGFEQLSYKLCCFDSQHTPRVNSVHTAPETSEMARTRCVWREAIAQLANVTALLPCSQAFDF